MVKYFRNKPRIKRLMKRCFVLLFIISSTFMAKAVHVAGGDITYIYKSSNGTLHTYTIIVSYYAYCSAAETFGPCSQCANPPGIKFNPDNSTTTLVAQSSCTPSVDLYESLNLTCCEEATRYCPGKSSKCAGGNNYGVSKWVYKGDVELEECSDWKISISIQNRNQTSASAVQPIYLETTFNNVNPYHDKSSPSFSNDPIIQPLSGISFTYNHGAYDPDASEGYVLEYALIQPRQYAGTNVVYNPGFTYDKPFGTSVTFSFDQSTGTFSAIPTAELTTIMAVRVNKIKNGAVISSVIRDFQIDVVSGTNNNPVLSEIDNIPGNGYTTYAAEGVALSFDIYGTDQDLDPTTTDPNDLQKVTFTGNNVNDVFGTSASICYLPDPDCNGTPANPAVATFLWPSPVLGTYCFTVTAEDNACNITTNAAPGTTTQTYCIIVEEKPCSDCPTAFSPMPGEKYIISGWVKESNSLSVASYSSPEIILEFKYNKPPAGPFKGSGSIIDGWQRVEGEFTVPAGARKMNIVLNNSGSNDVYFDDIRIFPVKASMKSFVYDPVSRRLMAELDERNYATFYEYNEEGALVRVKKETERGIMTIQESRSSSVKK